MKRVLFVLFCALLLGGWGWQRRQAAQKAYLKAETWIKHLNRSLFLAKTGRPLPAWMEEQISEDFAPFSRISKASVDATLGTLLSRMDPQAFIVRYRIVDNELYRFFLDGEPLSLEDNSTEKAIKTLLHCLRLPDMDFLLSYFDGIPVGGVTEELFRTDDPALQAPVFFSAKKKGAGGVVLIPDWRSIGHWWISDIKHIRSRSDRFPWEKKKPFALWRGSYTKEERLELCRLSASHPDLIDAKLNVPVTDPGFQAQLEQEGLFGQRASWEEFLECKYLPLADGVMCAAPAFQWRLLSNSLVFKAESDEIQWFYRALAPNVHYVPVKAAFKDLIEKLLWAKEHDAECKAIAAKAREFALEHLMYEDVLLYFGSVLRRYAALQRADGAELKREMREDPRWVKIQSRKKIERKGRACVPQATPF